MRYIVIMIFCSVSLHAMEDISIAQLDRIERGILNEFDDSNEVNTQLLQAITDAGFKLTDLDGVMQLSQQDQARLLALIFKRNENEAGEPVKKKSSRKELKDLYNLLLQAQYNSAKIAQESVDNQKLALSQQAQTISLVTETAARYKRSTFVGAVGTGVGALVALCSVAMNIYQAS